MQQPEGDLRRDALVVLRHLRFIALVLAVALAVALGSGLLVDATYEATAQVEVQGVPLPLSSGGRALSVVELARSPQVGRQVAIDIDVADEAGLAGRVSVAMQTGMPILLVTARGDSGEEAIALANAWAEEAAAAINSAGSSAPFVGALQRQAESARQRWEEAQRAATNAGADVGALERTLDGEVQALATGERELTNLEQATQLVRQASVDGSASVAQLRAALAGLAVPAEALAGLTSPQELLHALELRHQLLSLSLQRVAGQVDSLRKRRQELEGVAVEREAAEANYKEALRLVQAAQLPPLAAEVKKLAASAAVGGMAWTQRLGAAAAFGVVVGVVGAFGLEALPSLRRWFKGGEEGQGR